MHGWNGGGPMGWWSSAGYMAWMPVWWILGPVIVAAIVWAVVRWRRSRGAPGGDSPTASLKRRYASGEIDSQTYHRMLREIES